jgi:repressor LexA
MIEPAIEKATTRQKVFAFIKEHIHDKRFPPTIREIGVQVGLASTSAVHYHLDILRQMGLIRWTPGKARSIVLVKDEWS